MPRPPATVHDVARRAGVSIATVSRALAGSPAVRPETVAAVTAAAAALGYRPGFAARAMRRGRSRIVGVALVNHAAGHLQSLHNYEIVIGVNQGLERAGLLMALLRLDDLAGGPGALALREQTLDGIVAIGELSAGLRDELRRLCPRTVWVDGPEWAATGCLRRDEVLAGARAVEGIAAAGHRRIRYLDGGGGHHAFAQRRAGAEAAARRLGLSCTVQAFPEKLASGGGEAVLVSDLDSLRRLARHLAASGIRPGADLALACVDDAQDFREAWPELSRVAFDRYALGMAAAAMMEAAIAGAMPASRLLAGDWIAGTTLATDVRAG